MPSPASVIRSLSRDPEGLTTGELRTALSDSATLRGWQAGREARFIRVLAAREKDPSDPAKDTAGQVGRDQNLDAGQAKRKTKTAKQLEDLPETQAALEEGEITEGHADALADARAKADTKAKAALAEKEAELLAAGAKETPSQFRDRLDGFVKKHSADDGRSEWDRKKGARRGRTWWDKDGMLRISGAFDPESGQVVANTFNRVVDQLWRRDHQDHPADAPVPPSARDDEQRGADALTEICRRADQVMGPAKNQDRAVVFLSYEDLLGRLNGSGIASTLADGTPIPASVARRMACDAALIPLVLDGDSVPLDEGRAKRDATSAQRTALKTLWATCSLADCAVPYDWCQIHHIEPFNEDGHEGPTDLINLTPACLHCHDLAHKPGWTIEKFDDGLVRTTAPDGTTWERWPNGPAAKHRPAEPPPAAATDTASEPPADLFSHAA